MDEDNNIIINTIINNTTPTIVVDAVINFEAEENASPEVIDPETLLTADSHLQVPFIDTIPAYEDVPQQERAPAQEPAQEREQEQAYDTKEDKLTVFFNETYVIFLPDYFFKYSWYSYRYYSKIIKNLSNKGIKVINILKMVKYQENTHKSSLLFDDKKYPLLHPVATVALVQVAFY
jgi:hypothetical protein